MSDIIINGVKWRYCGLCEDWTDKPICKCFFKKELDNIFKKYRKQNDCLILVTPQSTERNGMSTMGINLFKFAFSKEQDALGRDSEC